MKGAGQKKKRGKVAGRMTLHKLVVLACLGGGEAGLGRVREALEETGLAATYQSLSGTLRELRDRGWLSLRKERGRTYCAETGRGRQAREAVSGWLRRTLGQEERRRLAEGVVTDEGRRRTGDEAPGEVRQGQEGRKRRPGVTRTATPR